MPKKSMPTSHRWNLSPGQRLQHYKGGLCTVVGRCTIESTLEPGVLYQSFDPLARKDVWMRPASDFWSQIKSGVPRFSLVRQPTATALWDSSLPGVMGVTLFKRVLEEYAGPERFYHGQEHLFDLFEKARSQGLHLSTEQALAVLLHDVVYVPGAPTGVNESESVDYMRVIQASASTQPTTPDWELVAKIILDTASHVPTCPQSEVVLMLDLSSLGGNPLEFSVANELVWLENRHLLQATSEPRKEFDTRRLAFLEALLAKGPLFTGVFADLETRWKENVHKLRRDWEQRWR
jgi:predicted metal-dependent HD superfamily phosphohydrolase